MPYHERNGRNQIVHVSDVLLVTCNSLIGAALRNLALFLTGLRNKLAQELGPTNRPAKTI